MLTRHDQNRRRILEKLLPLYGSDPANPIGVDGVIAAYPCDNGRLRCLVLCVCRWIIPDPYIFHLSP